MSYVAKNNAYGRLAAGVSAGATALVLQAGEGDRFPVVTTPDYTFVTLEDAAGNREIARVTAREAASDTLTVERGQEGTAARAWSAGDVVELRMVASLVQEAMAHWDKTSEAHAASAISATPVAGVTGVTVAAQLADLATNKEPKFATLPINKGGTAATTAAAARVSLGIEAAEVTINTALNATTNIGSATSQNIRLTTGVAEITGFAAAAAGVTRRLRAATGGFTMVHSPTTFILPGGVNIAVSGGDCFEAMSFGSGWVVRNYQRADGQAVTAPPSGVTSFNTRGGAVTLSSEDVETALGFTPANNSSLSGYALTGHTHAYAPMTAYVASVHVSPGYGSPYIRFTRANGTTFDMQMPY